MSISLKIDVTTGDKIVPDAISYDYPFAFEEGSARICAYPLETVLAEKLETVLSRSITNTRVRDMYDIYALWRIRRDQCNLETLRESVSATSSSRGSSGAIIDFRRIVDEIRQDSQMASRWKGYASENSFVSDIAFDDACDAVLEIMELITNSR